MLLFGKEERERVEGKGNFLAFGQDFGLIDVATDAKMDVRGLSLPHFSVRQAIGWPHFYRISSRRTLERKTNTGAALMTEEQSFFPND